MAVYTDVSDEELEAFIGSYAIGALTSFKGIAEGVENSNYLVHTDGGRYILTLYEKRVRREDLPYFLGADGASGLAPHLLPAAGQGSRRPHAERAGRPACGAHHVPRRLVGAAAQHRALRRARRALAHFHLAGADFPMFRANSLSMPGWRALSAAIGGERRYGRAGPIGRDREGAALSGRATGRTTCRKA